MHCLSTDAGEKYFWWVTAGQSSLCSQVLLLPLGIPRMPARAPYTRSLSKTMKFGGCSPLIARGGVRACCRLSLHQSLRVGVNLKPKTLRSSVTPTYNRPPLELRKALRYRCKCSATSDFLNSVVLFSSAGIMLPYSYDGTGGLALGDGAASY